MRKRRCFYCEEPEPEWDCFFTDGDGFLISLSKETKDKAICSDCVLALRDKIVYQYEEERIEMPYNGEFIFVNPLGEDNSPHAMVWLSNSNLLVTYGCLLMRQGEEAERLFREAQAQTMGRKGALWR